MEANPLNLNTSSLQQEVTSSLVYSTTGENRLVTVLYKKVEEMERKIRDLEIKKIIDETQFPPEVLAQSGILPDPIKKLKRGRGYRPILQSEIEEAKKHSVYAAGQARWLGVSSPVYKKYAKIYGIYEPRPNEKGKQNLYSPERGKYPLSKILSGVFKDCPSVTDWMVKDKLIRSGMFPPKCNVCGYNKRRIGDKKICLLVDHKNGDLRDFNVENLQLLCLNCTFECGRGYIRSGNNMFDPDWIQGAAKEDVNIRNRW